VKGNLTRRGKNSWRLKFDAGTDSATGKRLTKYVTLKGTKSQAQAEAAKIIASTVTGEYVDPSRETVAGFVRARINQWEAAGNITARTAQRYRQLVENQIVPHLGARALQKVTRLDVEGWHTSLRNSGLATRTIGHAHRVLGGALRDAERDGMVVKNVCKIQKPPKVAETEMVIVQDVPALITKIVGARLYVLGVVALSTGMRLGEILALRDRRLDLDRKVVEVAEALEETQAKGIVFKPPKSKAGRRKITLPDIAVEALREHRKQLLELRMKLGLGKFGPDDLLFPNLDGEPLRPSTVSSDWGELAERIGMPEITFHGLRHTHVSQLIANGVDIVTVSKRLGHAKPSVTLAIYAHMFTTDDSKAAAAINAALTLPA
jgi:integrase